MHTYNARESQLFRKLRWPSSMPFLFASLKVSIAISLVGAIRWRAADGRDCWAQAPACSPASYYGQTIQIMVGASDGSTARRGHGLRRPVASSALTVKRMGAR
jgi:NitT/TauT family transport system permease protein